MKYDPPRRQESSGEEDVRAMRFQLRCAFSSAAMVVAIAAIVPTVLVVVAMMVTIIVTLVVSTVGGHDTGCREGNYAQ